MTPEGYPETQLEAIRYFSDPETCHTYLQVKRWPGGVKCPYCQNEELGYVQTVRLWRCRPCKKRFSVKVGTIFEASPLPLSKWLPCAWIIVNAKNSVSSCEIARSLGVTQKTAWFMLHRVRETLRVGSFEKMHGIVEADETYIGAPAKNMHKRAREERGIQRGLNQKTIVMGVLQRANDATTTRARARVVKNTQSHTLGREIRKTVQPGAELHTDAWVAYRPLDGEYVHQFVDHVVEFVRGNVHTNGIENFWCLLKRMLKGTYVHVEAGHLDSYLDEQAWRYNERKLNDGERFSTVATAFSGRRLTYKQLIARKLNLGN